MKGGQIAVNIPSNLVPTVVAGTVRPFRQITVQDTALNMQTEAALAEETTHVFWTMSGGDARLRFDGTDPVAGTGHLIEASATSVWNRATWLKSRWIRQAAANASLQITEYTKP